MLIFTLFLTASSEWFSNSVVFDITDSNADEVLGKSQHVIIEFFAPYCHWCRIMFHEYEDLSKHYNSDQSAWKRPDILIARVNAMHNPKTTNKFRIFGFPTIIFVPAYSTDLKSIHEGTRTKAVFIEWVEHQLKELNENKFDRREPENEHMGHEVVNEENDEENNEEEDDGHEEEYAKFEMVIEDVSSHTSEKWRGEFNALNIKIDELIKAQQESAQDLLLEINQVKQTVSEQILQLLKRVEVSTAKIEEVGASVVNRNNIENTQSRFNPTHMIIFLTLGVILGFALSVYLVKISPSKVLNKV